MMESEDGADIADSVTSCTRRQVLSKLHVAFLAREDRFGLVY